MSCYCRLVDRHTHLVSKVVSNAIHRYELELRQINRVRLDVVAVLNRPLQCFRECRGKAMPLTIFQHFGAILGDKTTYRHINPLVSWRASHPAALKQIPLGSVRRSMSKSIASSGLSAFASVVPLLPFCQPGWRADFALDTFCLFGSEAGGMLEFLLFKPF
jgi:hypothetical protein